MIIVNELKPGSCFEYEKNLYQVLNTSLNKTAMRQMIVKVKVKNLRTGVINEISFTGGDKVEDAHVDRKVMQYLYDDGTSLVFMDNETYDQIEIDKERMKCSVSFFRIRLNFRLQNLNRLLRAIRQLLQQKTQLLKQVLRSRFRYSFRTEKWLSSPLLTANTTVVPDYCK